MRARAARWWLLLTAACVCESSALWRYCGQVPVPNAAMLAIATPFPGATSPTLLVTTFKALGADVVYLVAGLPALLQGQAANASVLIDRVTWPNQASLLPPGVFPEPAVLVAGGFLLPGKATGKVTIFLVPSARQLQVSHDKPGFFYHQAEWVDVNGDGRLDILTARAARPTLSPARAEMLWLEQPKDPAQVPWPEHVLFDGPGHNFVYADFFPDGPSSPPQILSAGFFAEQALALYRCEGGSWAACPRVARVVVDDTLGPYFSAQRVDLNGDGRADVLVTNNRADGQGAVLAYETPRGGGTGNWTRHMLASGYRPQGALPLPGHGAPGLCRAFLPTAGAPKPWILLSGDDSGLVHLLVPRSPDPADWEYDVQPVMKGRGTIGGVAAEDIDGDGQVELFVADYTGGKVDVFALRPPAPGDTAGRLSHPT